jgi:hypothetical protein
MARRGGSGYMREARRAAGARLSKGARMEHFLQTLTPLALAAVVVVLALGLINMMRGGSANLSQRLMRMRVLMQFVALVVIMASLYFAGH